LHCVDEFFKISWLPQLSLGFDTLTKYPDPNPETNTVDGSVYNATSGTFGTIRALTTAAYVKPDDTTGYACSLQAGSTSNTFNYMRRSYFLFDTSSITSSGTITGSIFSIYPNNVYFVALGNPTLDVVSSNPTSNTGLVSADFNISRFGTGTSFGSSSFSNFSTGDYRSVTLNESGIAAINKTSVTKFGTLSSWDRTGTFGGTWTYPGTSIVQCRYADYTGTSSDPKLVVNYDVPSIKTMNDLVIASIGAALGLAFASVKRIIGLFK
jgi:hypothetical protein